MDKVREVQVLPKLEDMALGNPELLKSISQMSPRERLIESLMVQKFIEEENKLKDTDVKKD